MIATDQEIKNNVLLLQEKGASGKDIEDYVKFSTQERTRGITPTAQPTALPGAPRSFWESAKEILPYAPKPFVSPPLYNFMASPGAGKAFGKGMLRGASFGTFGSSGIEGSVMEPGRRWRQAGELLGSMAPLAASSLTGGTAAGMLLPKAAGALTKSVVPSMFTGATYEAAKGAATGESPWKTLNSMASTASTFAGFGVIGESLNYLRSVFGDMAEGVANHFINTERRLAEKLFERGKPSLGAQYLKTDLPGFRGRAEVFKLSGNELSRLEGKIKDMLKESQGTIQTYHVSNSLDEIATRLETGTHPAELARVRRIKENFIKENPKTLTLDEAMKLKRKLDDRVSRAYLTPSEMKTPVSTEIDENLANALRAKIYEIDPEIGKLAAKESLLIRIRTGIKQSGIGTGGSRLFPHSHYSLYASIANALEGSPFANILAKGLKTATAPGVGQAIRGAETAARLGVAAPGGTVRFRDSEGAEHTIPKENLDEARRRDPGLTVLP